MKKKVPLSSIFTDRDLLITLLMGFASGLPLGLSGSTLQAWYAKSDISVQTIGFLGLVSLPYTIKFCWAPLMDRYIPPFLGRRRGWILLCQFLLAIILAVMAFLSPEDHPLLLMGIAGILAFFSASQDIAIDAYRVDMFTADKRALGAAMAVNGYRISYQLFSLALATTLAGWLGFQFSYLLMAAIMATCALFTILGPEPVLEASAPRSLIESIVVPFKDFFSRSKAIWILIFIVLYKLGDAFAGALVQTFLIRGVHLTLVEIGTLTKVMAFVGTILGTLVGGVYVPRLGLCRALLMFGIVQAVANLVFLPLLWTGPNYFFVGSSIFIDNFSGGMGTAAFACLLMSLCNHRFSAFQYALLSALSVVGRVYIGPVAGFIVGNYGWEIYFLSSLVFAAPGLILLGFVKSGIEKMSNDLTEERSPHRNLAGAL